MFCKYRPLDVFDLGKLCYKKDSKIKEKQNFIIDPIKK